MIADIHGALQAIGYALLVLFFVVGVVKTCGSFVEVKKPEHALKLFVRFVLAKALITYGMELMLAPSGHHPGCGVLHYERGGLRRAIVHCFTRGDRDSR